MRGIRISKSITDRQDESLKIFFKEISKYPLLDQDEEIELARRIQKGDEKALQKLVNSNLRFVVSVAKQYQGKGIPLVDLIQEGCDGIIIAAKKFDPNRGIKFISYAVWWIRQVIVKALSDHCRVVRVPVSQILYLSRINKSVEKLEKIYERPPSDDELGEDIDISSDKVNSTLKYSIRATSLDTPINEDNDSLLDIIPNNSDLVDEQINQNDLYNTLDRILNKLPNRESDILRMLFGIGMPPVSQEKIANMFGIGGERVRQIQHKGLDMIRKKYIKELNDLL